MEFVCAGDGSQREGDLSCLGKLRETLTNGGLSGSLPQAGMSGEGAGIEMEIPFCKLCLESMARWTGQRVRAARTLSLYLT